MRGIKFRGRSVEKKDWIYGFYFQDEDACFIKLPYRANRYGSGIEVHPESIGQFTELYDRDNKEIYEDDILQTPDGYGCIEYDYALFWVVIDDDNFIPLNCYAGVYGDDIICKVIGNKFDNSLSEIVK